ncbi:MAG: glutamyl-tRNA reductase [bacterium]
MDDASLPAWATPLVLGVSHHTSPVELREKLAFDAGDLPRVLMRLTERPGIREAMIVSTCNRVEVLAVGDSPEVASDGLASFLATERGVSPHELVHHSFRFAGRSAARHVFRVAASLDSLIVGEPQILGQVKTAYRVAADTRTVGTVLNRLCHRAFRVAKRVRTETRIGDHAVSVGFAAVELARKIFDSLDGKVVLVLGAGEMAELATRNLAAAGASKLLFANRTHTRAARMAEEFHGEAVPFDELASRIADADIVVCSTGAPHYVVTQPMVQAALKRRKRRPMFFIDISVPRNVDPEVNHLDNAYLYDVDDLEQVVDANWQIRRVEAARAEHILDEEVERFLDWLHELDANPVIRNIQDRWESIRQGELDRHRSWLAQLSETDRREVAELTRSLMGKLLHAPLSQLKACRSNGSLAYVDAARVLFDLDDEGRSRKPRAKARPLAASEGEEDGEGEREDTDR